MEMIPYRETSSDDVRAWDLTKSKVEWSHIISMISLGSCIVLAVLLLGTHTL